VGSDDWGEVVESVEQPGGGYYTGSWTTDAPAAGRNDRGTLRALGRAALHLGLLGATVVTTTIMGALLSVDVPIDEGTGFLSAVAALFAPLFSGGLYLVSGLVFSFTLLTILGAHELGHYVACRYHGVEASLPYFIPAPPPILIGTFGAFIRIRSPFTTRRALFDIGVAGPIAGFVFALPASLVGLLFAAPAAGAAPAGALVFNDPLLFVLLQRLLDLPVAIEWNPIHFAAWTGIFATGLNLIPVGQLDGGHAVYALFGDRGHRLLSGLFFAAIALLAAVAFARYDSPIWFLYVLILALLAFRRHPPALDPEDDIGWGRRVVAAAVAVIFLLSFMPFPVTIQ
jgi:membrane-associated protease RseP (regulator of RpoE activity)